MPLGTQVRSDALVLLVGATVSPAPAIPIGGLLNPRYPGQAPTQVRDYIGQASATSVGKFSRTLTIPCDTEAGDTGQKFLHDAMLAASIIFVTWRQDGTNGETLPMRVSSEDPGAPDANSFQTTTWTLNQAGAPVLVGTGMFA